ncbi:hypothetical protein V5F77_22720 [Xanthobacter sp. DSM 24535]|uniref:hypothetical protein n=1 Tax=Roseixanthobacter psychrophilus TaxID=3119917 RepID=UPI0037268B1C
MMTSVKNKDAATNINDADAPPADPKFLIQFLAYAIEEAKAIDDTVGLLVSAAVYRLDQLIGKRPKRR